MGAVKKLVLISFLCSLLILSTISIQGDEVTINEIGNIKFPEIYYNDVVIVNDYAYVTSDNGLMIYDISNPNQITTVANISEIGYCKTILHSNGYLFIVKTFAEIGVYDLVNPISPSLIKTYTHYLVHDKIMTIVNNTLYIAVNYDVGKEGLEAYNIENINFPIFLGRFEYTYDITPLYAGFYDIAVYNDFAYLSSSAEGIVVVNLTNFTEEKIIPYYTGDYMSARDITIANDHLFITDVHSGFYVYGLSNASNPNFVTKNSKKSAFVETSNNYVFVGASNTAITMYDISNPSVLTEVSSYTPKNGISGFSVSNGHLIAPAYSKGIELATYNSGNILFSSRIIFPTNSINQISAYGNTVYIRNLGQGVHIVSNISEQGIYIDTIENPGLETKSSKVFGNYLFITGSTIEIYDISTPVNPAFKKSLDISPYNIYFDTKSNILFVFSINQFQAFDLSNPTDPIQIASFDASEYFGRVMGVTLNDEVLTIYQGHEFASIYSIRTFNVTNLTSWKLLNEFDTTAKFDTLQSVMGNILYIGFDDILYIRDPIDFSLIKTLDNINLCSVKNDILFTYSESTAKIQVLRGDNTGLLMEKTISTNFYGGYLTASDDLILLGSKTGNGLKIFRISGLPQIHTSTTQTSTTQKTTTPTTKSENSSIQTNNSNDDNVSNLNGLPVNFAFSCSIFLIVVMKKRSKYMTK